jgi:hypothetical protein
MRERLISLIKDSLFKHIDKSCNLAENIADDLLENGVVLLPCKVGQTVYVVDKRLNVWWQGEVDCVYCNKNSFEYGILFDNDEYGAYNEEYVLFTKEEAERVLKGGTE